MLVLMFQKTTRWLVFGTFYGLLSIGNVQSDSLATREQILAPGYGSLQFTAPEPGTYQLQELGYAADGQVIDTTGKEVDLHQLMGDKIVLLSFIYSTCTDVNGCPLATAVFHRIKQRLDEEPELASEIRLLTLSFNPLQDTPKVMDRYGHGFQGAGLEWRFLTTRSEQTLRPILDSYRQSIRKEYDENGRFTGTFSHILRVYLIDRQRKLRNIYSVSFLHPDTLVNDMKTLLQESGSNKRFTDKSEISPVRLAQAIIAPLYLPGDRKKDYERSDYETQSISLTNRIGRAADLLLTIRQPPLGLPPVLVPEYNPVTQQKVDLGRKLFYDRRLSLNNTFSCAMCHIPEQGFTSNEMAKSVGIEGRSVRRNAPTIYNVAYFETLFHDSRETTLEQQVWGPLLARNEMANPSVGFVIEKINNSPDYQGLFEQVFDHGPSMETIGMAIASYERTLNSGNSPFDRWYYGKQENAISKAAQRGFELFTGKAGCSGCHAIEENHALFTDNKLHNTGIGYDESMGKSLNIQRVQVAPGAFVEVDAKAINAVSERAPNDLGRYEVTQTPKDRWKYKTPSLRNISLTGPYMHNGSLATLHQVIQFYNQGGVANKNLDSLIKPLQLNESEEIDLVEFLNALTGNNVEQLVSDAFASPVGDPQ